MRLPTRHCVVQKKPEQCYAWRSGETAEHSPSSKAAGRPKLRGIMLEKKASNEMVPAANNDLLCNSSQGLGGANSNASHTFSESDLTP